MDGQLVWWVGGNVSSVAATPACTPAISAGFPACLSTPHSRPHLCLQFDGDLKLPARYLVPPPAINGTSGERARLPSLLAWHACHTAWCACYPCLPWMHATCYCPTRSCTQTSSQPRIQTPLSKHTPSLSNVPCQTLGGGYINTALYPLKFINVWRESFPS